MREKFYGTLVTNGTHNATGDGSIAEMFGRVLDKEFSDSDTPDGTNLDLHHAFGFELGTTVAMEFLTVLGLGICCTAATTFYCILQFI